MRTKLILAFGILFLGLSIITLANDPVEKKTKKGKTINLEIVSEGDVNLYKLDKEIIKRDIPENPLESYTEIQTFYYIGNPNEEVVKKITTTNYKKLLSSHMANNTDVTTKIGSKGYKFINVEGIFMVYNSN